MKSSERRRRYAPLLILVAVQAVAVPATAHYAYFTGSIYQNNYVSANATGCIRDSGCINHSYTFISAEDTTGSNVMCARIWLAGGSGYDQDCAADFIRHCTYPNKHSGDPLDCHDQDHTSNFYAGAVNSSPGTTIRMHGGY
jgi:hypothetical protein